jgi:hypothetical protein
MRIMTGSIIAPPPIPPAFDNPARIHNVIIPKYFITSKVKRFL